MKVNLLTGLSMTGHPTWHFQDFRPLRKVLMFFVLLMFALPSLAGSFDWNDNYVWRDAKYNSQTHTWEWTSIVYNYEWSDEGWVKGNNLKTYLIRNGVSTLVGETSCGSDAKNMKFEPTKEGLELGFVKCTDGFNSTSKDLAGIYMKWVVPKSCLSKNCVLELQFVGKWTDNNSSNTKDINLKRDVSKAHQYVLWTPHVDASRETQLWLTGMEKGQPKWEYRIPFTMSKPVKTVQNPLYVDELSYINAEVSTLNAKGDYQTYRRDSIGIKLTDLCKVTDPTETTPYHVDVLNGKVFTFTPDLIYDSEVQTEPKILRNGMSLLLRNTYWSRFKVNGHQQVEVLHTVPEVTEYDLRIPAAAYPENLTATFIGNRGIVRLSWVSSSPDKVRGKWRIFEQSTRKNAETMANETGLRSISSDEPIIAVPTKDTTFVYDIDVNKVEGFFDNPNITYIVAWEPEALHGKENVPGFTYFPDLANSKQIDLTRYVQILKPECASYDQYLDFTWKTKTNQADDAWNGNCEIWAGDRRLAIVKPEADGGSSTTRTYRFQHISSACDRPEDVQYVQDNLTQCSPCTYEIRATYGNASAQYSKSVFENKAIGVGIAFRSSDVSAGVYSNKVRLSAATNNPDGVKLKYRILRREYGTDESKEVFTQDNGSANLSWEDYSAQPGRYYIYSIEVGYDCDEGKRVSIQREHVGFCQNTGTISGKISYNGGSAAQNINIGVEPNDQDSNNTGRNLLHSMELGDGGCIRWTVPDKSFASHINDGDFTVQFWISPMEESDDATIFRLGKLQLKSGKEGLSICGERLLQTLPLKQHQWTHITLSYNKKSRQYKVIAFSPVSKNGEYGVVDDSTITANTHVLTVSSADAFKLQRGDSLELGGVAGLYDDFRLYSRQLTMQELCETFDRHLHGEENGLEIYWTFNEGLPEYAFDTSRSGTQLNGRHGTVEEGRKDNNSNVAPNLGFRTRTDMYGNYVMRGIPFDGEQGVSYLLRPSFPGHSFAPESRQHIVSSGSLVFNASNFEDVSSFPFYGNVTYLYGNIPADSIEVRIDGMQQTGTEGALVTDRNGNFRVDVPIGEHYILLKRKGHVINGRWPAEGTHDFASAEGLGTEASPIHFTDSTLTLVAGRIVGGDIQAERPFAQHRDSLNRRSTANIGRGTVVLELAGAGNYMINSGKDSVNVAYQFPDSLNGVDGDCEAKLVPQTGKVLIRTNPRTGEFYAKLPPVAYVVDSVFTKDFLSYGLREDFGSTASYSFTPLPTDTLVDTLVTSAVVPATKNTPEAVETSGTQFMYNYPLVFVRHNNPIYELVDSSTIDSLNADSNCIIAPEKRKLYFGDTYYDTGNEHNIDLFLSGADATDPQKKEDMKKLYCLGYPVYRRTQHHFRLSAFEVYSNTDSVGKVKVDSVPLIGRAIRVVNGLGLTMEQAEEENPKAPVEDIEIDENGYCDFYVIPGAPNFTAPHLLNLALSDRVTGKEFFNLPVYVFGEKPVEGVSFVTKGPDKVDYVIHDPYGTNSSAWLEEGSTYSHTTTTTVVSREDNYSDNFSCGANGAFAYKWGAAYMWVNAGLIPGYDRTEQHIWTDGTNRKVVSTNKERISTSDSPDYVGPPADVFVGNSYNIRVTETRKLGLWRKDSETVPQTIDDVELDTRSAIAVMPEESTRFYYPRHHIENQIMPELKRLRRELFNGALDPKEFGTYTMNEGVDPDDPNLDWTKDEEVYTWEMPENTSACDLAKTYTQSLLKWEQTLRDDEWMQASYHESPVETPRNYSINTGSTYGHTYSSKIASTTSKREEKSLKKYFTFDFDFCFTFKSKDLPSGGGGGGDVQPEQGLPDIAVTKPRNAGKRRLGILGSKMIKVTVKLTAHTKNLTAVDYEDKVNVTTDTYTSNLNWGYQLKETVLGNSVSQDVYTTELATLKTAKGDSTLVEGSPIFILRGGLTRSPWEKALHMKYFDMKDPGNPDNVIGSDTQPMAVPVISFPDEINDHEIELSHLRAGHPVTVNMRLESLSPQTFRGIDYILTSYAVGDATALQMKVDGASIVGVERSYRISQGQPVNTPLVLNPVRPDKYDYDTYIYLLAQGQSSYDSPMGYIADSVHLKLHFDPTSSDVSIRPGASVLNNDSKGNLQLYVENYDSNLDNFCCIDLMYRRPDEGEFNHTFARYWVNSEVMEKYADNNTIPVIGKEYQQAALLPDGTDFVHDFDMSGMYDGEYYITAVARSYYPNGAGGSKEAFAAEYQCEPIQVRKDMTAPEVLGRPAPVGGYLTVRDQATATFNEDINTNRLVKYRNICAYVKDGETLTPLDLDFTADERHIYIDLERVHHTIHSKIVRCVLKGVEDLAGNVMKDSVYWDVYADLSTLDWDDQKVNITASVSDLAYLKFSRVLLNNTARAQQFALSATPEVSVRIEMPDMLAADMQWGTVPALSTLPIEFRFTGIPEIGQHKFVVYVISDDESAIRTPLEINLTVVGDEPDISFDESRYPDNMSFIGTLTVPEGGFRHPDRDLLYAFVGTTCVGKTNIKAAADGSHSVFMEIYGNNEMAVKTPEVKFVAWDAATNTLYPTVTTANGEVLKYGNNKMVGTVAAPVELVVRGDAHLGVELAEGWTWTSFNVNTSSTFKDILTPLLQNNETVTVKSATDAIELTNTHSVGALVDSVPNPARMYAVKLQNESLLRLVGAPANPADHVITLAPEGWTWIGYTPQSYSSLNDALVNLKATEGDIIKSQTAFSVFHTSAKGTGWYGNLDMLMPGVGYKYHSNNTEAVSFCYVPSNTGLHSKVRRQAVANTHWNVNTYYADNMTVLGRVFADGEPLRHGEIGCFVGTECRGRVGIDADGYAFMVVQGINTGESIQCYYWDDETETEHIITPALSYSRDASVGTFDSPVIFALDDASGITVVEEAGADYEYYNLQGLRVDGLALQRGCIYIRTNGVTTDKILKK